VDTSPASNALLLKSQPRVTFRRKFVTKLLRYVIVFVVMAACEALILLRFRRVLLLHFYPYLQRPNLLRVLLLLLLVYYVTLVIHECGHVLGARLVGFRFLHIIAGPLKIERTRHGIRVGLHKSIKIFQGWASGMPLDAHHLRSREIIFYAGGPLGNFVQAIVFAACSFWPDFPAYSPIPLILRLAAGFALFAALANLVPLRTSDGYLTDGAGILLLLKGGLPVERWCATSKLAIEVAQGLLPREWNADLLQSAQSLPDGTPEDVGGCSYAYYHALDSDDIAGARMLLERMLVARMDVPASLRRWLALEAAYFEARYHHNAAASRAWFGETKGIAGDSCAKLRAEAAVLLAEGKTEKARLCIQKGLAKAKDALFIGTELREEAWLRDLLGLLEA
jgi:Zn-dependent protease